jgi:hypothetical protein
MSGLRSKSYMTQRIFIGDLTAAKVIFGKVDMRPPSTFLELNVLFTIFSESTDITGSVTSRDIILCSCMDLSLKEL